MTLILIDLPEYINVPAVVADLTKNFTGLDVTVEIGPNVYVVEHESNTEQPAVFARHEDAEAYTRQFSLELGIERVTIADAATAALMIAEQDDES
jgi:hypothetical protein